MRRAGLRERTRTLGARPVQKCPTGISGLDKITAGGLPRGRPTLVCGGAGCGKTLLGMEFLIRGVTEFHEPGVCMSFEEGAEELAANVASLGFDTNALVAAGKLKIDYVHIDRSQIEETGEYNLDGLFIRLSHAIDSVGAKRVLLDTIESLFSGLANEMILRNDLRRLFRWLKERGVTAVVTGERGHGTLTRHGLEEYISDCVILLDHRVENSVFTRRLRIVKYRGSTHGTNEYPFLIDQSGISVLPITSVELTYPAFLNHVSTGVPGLDEMLANKGYFRGSTVLISGSPGTGKTSTGAHFIQSAVRRKEKALVFAFEESRAQWLRNMKSIGIDLEPAVKKGLLRHDAYRPTTYGLEMHLVRMHKAVEEFRPDVVLIDPISALAHAGATQEVSSVLLRLVDYLKSRGITTVLTMLLKGATAADLEHTGIAISSMVDTWVLLRDIEDAGERNRGVFVLKSRGMSHSNQIREYRITSKGIVMRDAYLGPDAVLTGSARLAQELRNRAAESARKLETEVLRRKSERKRMAIEAQIAALRADAEAEQAVSERLLDEEQTRLSAERETRREMAVSRHAKSNKRPGPEATAGGRPE